MTATLAARRLGPPVRDAGWACTVAWPHGAMVPRVRGGRLPTLPDAAVPHGRSPAAAALPARPRARVRGR